MKEPKYSNSSTKKLQSSLKGNIMSSWRYSLNFTLEEEHKGTTGLRDYFAMIMKEMQTYCKEACFLPWHTDDYSEAIRTPEKLPKTITMIKKYFNNARPSSNGGQGYTKVRIGLPVNQDRPTFDTDFQEWAKGKNIKFYETTVQTANSKSCGWLVYAPRSLNRQKWCQAVMRMYQQSYKTPGATINIGLSWRALNGQRELSPKDKTYAMHIESPAEQNLQVKRFLRIISRKKIWPLGVKFRLMSDFHIHMKDSNKERHRYMVNKHKAFQTQMKEASCYQFVSIDKKIRGTNTTTRELITSLRDSIDGRRIFGSVDEHWRNSLEYTVTYRPDKEAKAYAFLKSFSTYAMHKFPQASLGGTFSVEAIAKSHNETFNPNTQEFVTEDDEALCLDVNSDMDDDSLDFLEIDEATMNAVRLEIAADHPVLVGGESTMDLQGDEETASTASNLTPNSVCFQGISCYDYDENSAANMSSVTSQTVNSTITDEMQSEQETQPPTLDISELQKQIEISQAKLTEALKAASSKKEEVAGKK